MALTAAQLAAIGAPPANPTSEYRYLATNLLSGAIVGDWIPMDGTYGLSLSRQVNGTGTFTGALSLTAGNSAEQAAWRKSIANRRTVIWLLLDGTPVWNGILWDWQPQTILDGTMPFSASTFDSLFAYRVIQDDLTFTGMDVFDIFRSLVTYALTKDFNTQVAGLNLGNNESGVSATVTFTGSDMQLVSDAWQNMVAEFGFEYAFAPGLDVNGNLTTYLNLGYPELGLAFPQSGLAYNMPGNLLDYQWTATGSTSSNKVIATATDSSGSGATWTSQYPAGYDLVDLNAGNPLLEQAVSVTTISITDQAEINAYATGYLPAVTGTQLTPTLWLANGQGPAVSDIVLGSWCQLALTSPLHPAGPNGEPGFQGQGRIIGWSLYPPTDQQAEYTWLNLWIPVPYLPDVAYNSAD
jgi:hypothetical protein